MKKWRQRGGLLGLALVMGTLGWALKERRERTNQEGQDAVENQPPVVEDMTRKTVQDEGWFRMYELEDPETRAPYFAVGMNSRLRRSDPGLVNEAVIFAKRRMFPPGHPAEPLTEPLLQPTGFSGEYSIQYSPGDYHLEWPPQMIPAWRDRPLPLDLPRESEP